MAKPVLGYFPLRGVGQVIRTLLVHLDVDFEDRRYPLASDGSSPQWIAEKHSLGLHFPNIPFYIDGEDRITQTIAILRYIARKYNANGNTATEKLRISLIEQQVSDLNLGFFRVAYDANWEKLKPDYLQALPAQMQPLSDFLGQLPFVAGTTISYADFWMYEYLIKIKVLVPEVFERFDNLVKFVERIESLPRVAEFVKTQGDLTFGKPGLCLWNGTYSPK